MLECWSLDAQPRPTFQQLYRFFNESEENRDIPHRELYQNPADLKWSHWSNHVIPCDQLNAQPITIIITSTTKLLLDKLSLFYERVFVLSKAIEFRHFLCRTQLEYSSHRQLSSSNIYSLCVVNLLYYNYNFLDWRLKSFCQNGSLCIGQWKLAF